MSEAIRLEGAQLASSGVRAGVGGASLVVLEGEHILIKGAEGSGKLALMRLIAGMDRPSDGKVFVLGKPLNGMAGEQAARFRGRSVGSFLGEKYLMPDMSVWENAALRLTIQGVPVAARRKAAMEALRLLGIQYAVHALPGSLNLYEAKLVMLAQTLIAKPKVLLLYEIMAGLDEAQLLRLASLLEGLSVYQEAAAVVFASGEVPLSFQKRFTLEYGTLREENT